MAKGTVRLMAAQKQEDRKGPEIRQTLQMIFHPPGPKSCFLLSLNNAIRL